MEWTLQLLEHGPFGFLSLLLVYAVMNRQKKVEELHEALRALEQKRGDENKERLSQVLQAMGERQRSQTGYSMQTSTSRTRE